MKNIVVTTDLSANSRSAGRFAIRMAQQCGARIHFLHVHYVLRASMWTELQYDHYRREAKRVLTADLTSFIQELYRSTGHPAGDHKRVLYENLDTADGIMSYANEINADLICTSTRGAGLMAKVVGSTASRLINHSDVPVLCIPSDYRSKKLKDLLYVTDMEDYAAELPQVAEVASDLQLRLGVLHLFPSYEFVPDMKLMEESMKRYAGCDVSLQYEARDPNRSIVEDLRDYIARSKPGILVLFTHQHKNFFERLLLPGNAAHFSGEATFPLLSFRKSSVSNDQKPEAAAARKSN